MAVFKGRGNRYLILSLWQFHQLPMAEAKPPISSVVAGAVWNPIWRVRQRKKMRSKLLQGHFLVHGYAVIDDMQIRILEVNDSLALRILDVSVLNIPFRWHRPIKHPGPRGHLMQGERDEPLQTLQGLTKTSPCDAPTNWIQFRDQGVHFLS